MSDQKVKYRVWWADEETEDDSRQIYCYPFMIEAEIADIADERCSDSGGEYSEESTVIVRGPDGAERKFEVTAEPTIEFHAREVTVAPGGTT